MTIEKRDGGKPLSLRDLILLKVVEQKLTPEQLRQQLVDLRGFDALMSAAESDARVTGAVAADARARHTAHVRKVREWLPRDRAGARATTAALATECDALEKRAKEARAGCHPAQIRKEARDIGGLRRMATASCTSAEAERAVAQLAATMVSQEDRACAANAMATMVFSSPPAPPPTRRMGALCDAAAPPLGVLSGVVHSGAPPAPRVRPVDPVDVGDAAMCAAAAAPCDAATDWDAMSDKGDHYAEHSAVVKELDYNFGKTAEEARYDKTFKIDGGGKKTGGAQGGARHRRRTRRPRRSTLRPRRSTRRPRRRTRRPRQRRRPRRRTRNKN